MFIVPVEILKAKVLCVKHPLAQNLKERKSWGAIHIEKSLSIAQDRVCKTREIQKFLRQTWKTTNCELWETQKLHRETRHIQKFQSQIPGNQKLTSRNLRNIKILSWNLRDLKIVSRNPKFVSRNPRNSIIAALIPRHQKVYLRDLRNQNITKSEKPKRCLFVKFEKTKYCEIRETQKWHSKTRET